MLHYDLEKKKERPLYEALYEFLKEDILRGRFQPGTRLPSKRELARDNGISVKTVLGAYEQLLVEGYITSQEKRGYFVANVETMEEYHPTPASYPQLYQEEQWFADFTSNNTVYPLLTVAKGYAGGADGKGYGVSQTGSFSWGQFSEGGHRGLSLPIERDECFT